MDTLLGTGDASRPSQWWGYLRGDGTTVLERYTGMQPIKDAEQHFSHVSGPFIAFGQAAGMAKLRDKIATAATRAAHKRLEAMSPSCPIREDRIQSDQGLIEIEPTVQ